MVNLIIGTAVVLTVVALICMFTADAENAERAAAADAVRRVEEYANTPTPAEQARADRYHSSNAVGRN